MLADFFVPRGWVIFFGPEWLGDFFLVPRGLVTFLCSGRMGDFFLIKLREKFCFLFVCPKRLCDLFVSRGRLIFVGPRGCVIFLSQEVRHFFSPENLHDFFL